MIESVGIRSDETGEHSGDQTGDETDGAIQGIDTLKGMGGWNSEHQCWTRRLDLEDGKSVTVLEVCAPDPNPNLT